MSYVKSQSPGLLFLLCGLWQVFSPLCFPFSPIKYGDYTSKACVLFSSNTWDSKSALEPLSKDFSLIFIESLVRFSSIYSHALRVPRLSFPLLTSNHDSEMKPLLCVVIIFKSLFNSSRETSSFPPSWVPPFERNHKLLTVASSILASFSFQPKC